MPRPSRPMGRRWQWAGSSTAIAILDADTGRERAQLSGRSAFGLAFLPGDKTLVAGMGDGTVALWDVEAGRVRTAFPGPGGCIHGAGRLTRRQVAGGWRHPRRVVGRQPRHLVLDPVRAHSTGPGRTAADHGARVLARLEDAGRGLPGGDDRPAGPAAIYSRRPPWKAHEGRVRALAFSPDGKSLASVGQDAHQGRDAADARLRMSLPGRVSPGGTGAPGAKSSCSTARPRTSSMTGPRTTRSPTSPSTSCPTARPWSSDTRTSTRRPGRVLRPEHRPAAGGPQASQGRHRHLGRAAGHRPDSRRQDPRRRRF